MSTHARAWQFIPGFSDYLISNYGVVHSLFSGKPLTQHVHSKGYHYVTFWRRNKRINKFVHHLVLLSFVGPRPLGQETSHIDGDRTNNRLTNLRWETHRENEARKRGHGTLPRGAKNGAARFCESDIPIILDEARRFSFNYIARKYHCGARTIAAIVCGKNWSWVRPDILRYRHNTRGTALSALHPKLVNKEKKT